MSEKLISETYSAEELIKNKGLAEKVISINIADGQSPVKMLEIAKREFPDFENDVELTLRFRSEPRRGGNTIFGYDSGSDGDPYYEMQLKRSVSEKFVNDFYENIDRVSARDPHSKLPPLNEIWFELEVDHSTIKPCDIIKLYGKDPDIWEYIGPDFEGEKIYRVKLITLDYCSLRKAKAVVSRMGYRFVECQAVKSFVKKFPIFYPSGRYQIIFGGSEFKDYSGKLFVPCLSSITKGCDIRNKNNKKWNFSLESSVLVNDVHFVCQIGLWLVESIK